MKDLAPTINRHGAITREGDVTRRCMKTFSKVGGKSRRLVVTLRVGDVIELRPEGCRIRWALPMAKVYNLAIFHAANQMRIERAARRKARKEGRE